MLCSSVNFSSAEGSRVTRGRGAHAGTFRSWRIKFRSPAAETDCQVETSQTCRRTRSWDLGKSSKRFCHQRRFSVYKRFEPSTTSFKVGSEKESTVVFNKSESVCCGAHVLRLSHFQKCRKHLLHSRSSREDKA
jgi:hypothetical protein